MKRILDLPDISDPLEFRDKAILELFYSTGIRREELRNINVYDLDLENGFLKVKGKGKRERMVPVGKTACSWILKYLDKIRPEHVRDPKEQAFFLTRSGGRLCCELIAQIVKKYLNKAGLSGFSTHSIRHAFASHLIQNGCQVKYIQEMLGHSSLDTTKIYTHLRKEDQREALERSHPEGRGGRV
jgi:site-specific recombinase XerD